MSLEYLNKLNKKFKLNLTGFTRSDTIPKDARRLVVKDYDNGMSRVIYANADMELIADLIEKTELETEEPKTEPKEVETEQVEETEPKTEEQKEVKTERVEKKEKPKPTRKPRATKTKEVKTT